MVSVLGIVIMVFRRYLMFGYLDPLGIKLPESRSHDMFYPFHGNLSSISVAVQPGLGLLSRNSI